MNPNYIFHKEILRLIDNEDDDDGDDAFISLMHFLCGYSNALLQYYNANRNLAVYSIFKVVVTLIQ